MKELDPLLHSQLRLAVMSILMNVDEADFVFLKEKPKQPQVILAYSSTNFQMPDISLWKGICRQENQNRLSNNRTRAQGI